MARLLNESAQLIGALVEFDKLHHCCAELARPPLGAFWLMSARHGLCAHQAPIFKPVHAKHTPLASLCEARGTGHQVNLRWQPCPGSE